MDARTKIVIGTQFAAWGDAEISENALAQLVERGLRQPELLKTDNFRRRFSRLVQLQMSQAGSSRAEIVDGVEDRLQAVPGPVAETLREILASSLMPPLATGESGLVTLLSRLSGARAPHDAGRCLLTFLQERFGRAISGQIFLSAPKPEVIASLEGSVGEEEGSFTVHWREGEHELGHMTIFGLNAHQREQLGEIAPWLQPTFRRLVETQQMRDSELIYARQRRQWQIKAEMLDLAQKPQSSETYLHQVVGRVQKLLNASQVVYWIYHPEDDSLEAALRAVADHGPDVPVSAGVFQEAVINREVKTAAIEDGQGALKLFLLGPVFQENELEGVFQVILPGMQIGLEAEAELQLISELVASGLRTVRFYEQLSYHASHDPLTGLANRRTFEQFLSREFKLAERHETPISLIVVDLDHFKQYNDRFGHPAGDQLLRDIAGALVTAVRSTDFVARYGGEEFVIVLPHTGPEGALAAANKVLEGIRNLHTHATVLSGVATASVGVASYPGDASGMTDLIQEADQAMYRAKASGRNRIRTAS